jgi:hypothetical protein
LADYFRGELKLAQRQWSYVILLFFEIIFIALLFLLPKVFDAIVNHNGEVILDKVLPLNAKSDAFDIATKNSDNSTTVSLTQSLIENVKTNTPHYSYGISAWFYIHPEPPKNSYSSSNNDVAILNFATDANGIHVKGSPQVLFNPNENHLIISVLTETNKTVNVTLPSQILLQRWNHLFINFNNNGIMDVFLNNHLESSTPNVIPKLPKALIVGSDPGGIYGQVCNVVYYKDVVGSDGVSWIYNSHKLLNPPLKPNF